MNLSTFQINLKIDRVSRGFRTVQFGLVRRITKQCDKRLFASPRLIVGPHETNSVPTGRIFVKFHI